MSPTVHAAGALVWREKKGRLQVLLVHRPSYQDWSWPKGKVDKGEWLPAAAVREVEEETGYRIALAAPLSTVRYRLVSGKWKVCHYWAAELTDSLGPWAQARAKVGRASKKEIDDHRWVEASKAIKRLSYPHDRAPLFDLLERYHAGRLQTRTLMILRHARAKRRQRHGGKEASRPLTSRIGVNQAHRLPALLSAFGAQQLVTSPWKRCVDTLTPYAQLSGIDLQREKALTESRHGANPEAVEQLVRRAAKSGGVPQVVCTHRPVLETVMATLATITPARLRADLPREDPWLDVGELLIAHLAVHHKHGWAPIALERYRS
ncbi:MAG: NUDIX hydrolase [Bowdeniella nasicola]|nr:NUDIX hydrolase [Bowdeniella nasicola]